MALSVDGFSDQAYEVNMNKIHMSLGKFEFPLMILTLDKDSISILSDAASDNINETPLDHDVLNRMVMNQSLIEVQQINDPAKFQASSVKTKNKKNTTIGADKNMSVSNMKSPDGSQGRKPENAESDEGDDPMFTHRDIIKTAEPPKP